jgi:hypothetical protein
VLLLATAMAGLTCVPSTLSVTVSPATPVPEIAGVAVVVSVLLFAGLVKTGAGGVDAACALCAAKT